MRTCDLGMRVCAPKPTQPLPPPTTEVALGRGGLFGLNRPCGPARAIPAPIAATRLGRFVFTVSRQSRGKSAAKIRPTRRRAYVVGVTFTRTQPADARSTAAARLRVVGVGAPTTHSPDPTTQPDMRDGPTGRWRLLRVRLTHPIPTSDPFDPIGPTERGRVLCRANRPSGGLEHAGSTSGDREHTGPSGGGCPPELSAHPAAIATRHTACVAGFEIVSPQTPKTSSERSGSVARQTPKEERGFATRARAFGGARDATDHGGAVQWIPRFNPAKKPGSVAPLTTAVRDDVSTCPAGRRHFLWQRKQQRPQTQDGHGKRAPVRA